MTYAVMLYAMSGRIAVSIRTGASMTGIVDVEHSVFHKGDGEHDNPDRGRHLRHTLKAP